MSKAARKSCRNCKRIKKNTKTHKATADLSDLSGLPALYSHAASSAARSAACRSTKAVSTNAWRGDARSPEQNGLRATPSPKDGIGWNLMESDGICTELSEYHRIPSWHDGAAIMSYIETSIISHHRLSKSKPRPLHQGNMIHLSILREHLVYPWLNITRPTCRARCESCEALALATLLSLLPSEDLSCEDSDTGLSEMQGNIGELQS